ncbi:uncharacterized protein LOC131843626 [Achroia grisella]|uniref:uncharacterized protein LOC131843626 n=1 Tax=Achroia grisella TaxID=688607 RepID=UPI0027D28524|nr:uncharacterized protein LOC131843626 [Achroia grisella]
MQSRSHPLDLRESLKHNGAAANKLARSHIPCRRALVKNTSGSVAGKSNLFITGTPNIHRVQVLNISPDFSSKDQIPTTSVASTRPIPKLQEIYRQNDVITDEQRLYDWFIELATPVLSQHTSPDSLQNNISNNTKQSVTNTGELTKKVKISTYK